MQQPPPPPPREPGPVDPDRAPVSHAGRRMTALAAGIDATWRSMVVEVAAGRHGSIDGLSVQVWLDQGCRLLPLDARTVQCVASTLDTFPSLDEAW